MKKWLTALLLSTPFMGAASVPDLPLRALQVGVRLPHMQQVKTVGEAVENVLMASGYALALHAPLTPTAVKIWAMPLHQPLPAGIVMSILDALLLLIGEQNSLLIDPQHHLISFEATRNL